MILSVEEGRAAAVEWRTRGKTLLELLSLVGVLEDKGVDEALASDLELDVAGLGVLLYARSCNDVSNYPLLSPFPQPILNSLYRLASCIPTRGVCAAIAHRWTW